MLLFTIVIILFSIKFARVSAMVGPKYLVEYMILFPFHSFLI